MKHLGKNRRLSAARIWVSRSRLAGAAERTTDGDEGPRFIGTRDIQPVRSNRAGETGADLKDRFRTQEA